MNDRQRQRDHMVETQLIPRGINDPRVLEAFRSVPRHAFVPPALEGSAYGDHALPIGDGQTISQPFMVALMTQALDLSGDERVLEIGTGSGYQTAILSEVAGQVFSIERVPALAERARRMLEELGAANVAIRVGDGTIGWKEFEPFDRIMVTAGAPEIPSSLIEQLADPGRMVIPVGSQGLQDLKVVTKDRGAVEMQSAGGCVFVPLLGREGWGGNGNANTG
ncbi:MAG: protein-L-isoaspartate(D-aspartate) O-methyltransferase [Candidatus Eisenbacteria bacterium]|nr:protein-L-isoaspartate(D-aspartate) O-methyltransferase [Candidatus Eisenbacteria bacterium]